MSWWRRDEAPRPRLDLPLDLLDRGVEAAALAGWLTLLAVSVAVWPALPSRLPTHFDLAGRPDGWGSRTVFLALPITGSLLYLGLTVIGRLPHRFNYPWPITAANAARQYRLARRLVAALKGLAAWLFAGMVWGTAAVATGSATALPAALPLAFLLAIPLCLALYFVAARRAR